jgi:hypothetical protein
VEEVFSRDGKRWHGEYGEKRTRGQIISQRSLPLLYASQRSLPLLSASQRSLP